MSATDQLVRGINAEHNIRVVAAITTELTREACRRHELTGTDAAVMGRALTAGCLLATLTKNDDERVRIQVRGDGPSGRVLIDARSDGSVRGCLQSPRAHRPRPRSATRSGAGRSSSPATSGSSRSIRASSRWTAARSMSTSSGYLTDSEQLPSVLACTVVLDGAGGVLRAGGALCQTFPEADVGALDPLRDNVRGDGIADLFPARNAPRTSWPASRCSAGRSARSNIGALAVQVPMRPRSGAGTCCRRSGRNDVAKLADEQSSTEVKCSYCNDAYVLSSDDLRELAQRLREERS